ncbi:hypothetical protein LTR86_006129 [Recurvomyces mirabilis]|nr:hypothetical protein LTR86_006129 [Recurvomyces mirabilis]
MARLIDLSEEEDIEPPVDAGGEVADQTDSDDMPGPNIGCFSAALTCYPVVSQLATYLDLNSLHELSRTCRQFRAHLMQYRDQLMEQSLRCDNENANPAARLGNALHASLDVWTAYGRDGVKIGRITSGKLGACARDLNCTMKPPSSSALKDRHRRLCRSDMKLPLDRLTVVRRSYISSQDSAFAAGVTIKDVIDLLTPHSDDTTSSKTLARGPCTCATEVWICQPCGHALRTKDITYTRGWAWRKQYKTCGGFGAGLGEGNEGVECGRGKDCQAVQEVYHEIECDADGLAALDLDSTQAEVDGRHWEGSSYLTQEVVGIGGAVKKKVKKRVLVGAAVKEYEDEREHGTYLAREQKGLNRSYCSWCERVLPGKKDMEDPGRSSDSVVTSSSSDAV